MSATDSPEVFTQREPVVAARTIDRTVLVFVTVGINSLRERGEWRVYVVCDGEVRYLKGKFAFDTLALKRDAIRIRTEAGDLNGLFADGRKRPGVVLTWAGLPLVDVTADYWFADKAKANGVLSYHPIRRSAKR